MHVKLFLTLIAFYAVKGFGIEYFPEDIDYWKNIDPEKNVDKEKPEEQENPNSNKFNWDQYLNPKTNEDLKEVFREGDHVPPTPLLEVTNNPTDDNIKRWFQYIEKKNQLQERLNRKMAEYLEKNKSNLKEKEQEFFESKLNESSQNNFDIRRFRFRMYFESSCPHCKRMMSELVKIQDRGFYVELRQIDRNKQYSKALPFVVNFASREEIEKKKISSWPVLFIGDSKKQIVYRINGYQTAEEILSSLKNK